MTYDLFDPFNEVPVIDSCANCVSLQQQNTELNRKLADYEQTCGELCESCGWRFVVPGRGCLNCEKG